MFKRILIGIDNETGGRDAIALAEQFIGAQTRLTLASVHVLSPAGKAGAASFYVGRGVAETLLAKVEDGLPFEADHRTIGAPSVGRGLHCLAEADATDLLVVGSNRHGGLGRVLLGDTTRDALSGAPCAVAVAPAGYAEHPRALREIGVGFKESPEGQNALEVASALATELGGELTVLENAADPAQDLTAFSGTVDLLVLGSRDEGPVGRLVHGSTSRRLARTSASPLLILTRGSRTQMAVAGIAGNPQHEPVA